MNRIVALVYGAISYVIFFVTFLYLVGFLGNVVVPKSIDSGTPGPLGQALLINTALLLVFGLQHSVMARPRFKAAWTRIVPREIERPTYVLASSLVLIALFAAWQPIPATVWQVGGVTGAVLFAGLFVGVGLVLYSTFLIDHFDLFGLRQVVLHFRRKAYEEKRFATPSLYRFIRHPLYVGWFVTFWATPVMTAGHLLFAVVMTAYVLVAIPLEERDLEAALGDDYRRWRERTPAVVPRVRGSRSVEPGRTATLPG